MSPKVINQTLILCVCRRPIRIQVAPGQMIRVPCHCGNVVCVDFPQVFADRKAELRHLIDAEPSNRWEALGIELLIDELRELEKTY